MENGLIGRRLAVLQGDRRKKILSVASSASDGWRTSFTPFSSDQMIRNLSMKIGEVDSGSARLLCAASSLTDSQTWNSQQLGVLSLSRGKNPLVESHKWSKKRWRPFLYMYIIINFSAMSIDESKLVGLQREDRRGQFMSCTFPNP